jgi:hypothetical protein
VPETTTTPDPAATCTAYAAELSDLLTAIADSLTAGADIAAALTDGTLSSEDAVDDLEALAEDFDELGAALAALGTPPEPMAEAAAVVAQAIEVFAQSYERQAQGARDEDQAAIDEGVLLLDRGSSLLAGFGDALRPCDGGEGDDVLATPAENDVEVFLRTAEILLADTPYDGLGSEVLVAGAQAACLGLAEGGVEEAIRRAIAETPAEGAPFLADEQSLALILVTRGVPLWCPQLVDDEAAYTDEVVSTIVDIFFEE